MRASQLILAACCLAPPSCTCRPEHPVPSPSSVCSITMQLQQDPNSSNLGTTVWDASIVSAAPRRAVRRAIRRPVPLRGPALAPRHALCSPSLPAPLPQVLAKYIEKVSSSRRAWHSPAPRGGARLPPGQPPAHLSTSPPHQLPLELAVLPRLCRRCRRTRGAATLLGPKSRASGCWSWGRAWAWQAWRWPCWAQVRGRVASAAAVACRTRRGSRCGTTAKPPSPLPSTRHSLTPAAEVVFTDIGDVLPLLQRNVSENIAPAALKLRGATAAAAEARCCEPLPRAGVHGVQQRRPRVPSHTSGGAAQHTTDPTRCILSRAGGRSQRGVAGLVRPRLLRRIQPPIRLHPSRRLRLL